MAPLMNTYTQSPVNLVSGSGSRVTDSDGRTYLDWLAGISVSVLGHGHPDLIEAISQQAGRLLHVSNLFTTPQGLAAADAITAHLGDGSVFFCNSGAESVEAAIKFSRKRAWRLGRPDQIEIVTLNRSFHGRTYGALSATQQPKKWEGFGPMLSGFIAVEPNDVEALKAAFNERTAALIIEPVLGEGGVIPLTQEFANAAKLLCILSNAVLIADEVQTGMGRTGKWWGHEHLGLQPDAVTLAKGLAGGLPAGALWVRPEHADVLQPGDHASTFGGGPLVGAAIQCVFEVIQRDGLVARASSLGDRICSALTSVAKVRGRGLLLAAELDDPIASEVATIALRRGMIVNAVTRSAVRIAPPLILTNAEADEGASILSDAILEARS